eukprot:COSAG01_NODE_2002_length_8672_cov_53.309227_7_plen_69_part_00
MVFWWLPVHKVVRINAIHIVPMNTAFTPIIVEVPRLPVRESAAAHDAQQQVRRPRCESNAAGDKLLRL